MTPRDKGPSHTALACCAHVWRTERCAHRANHTHRWHAMRMFGDWHRDGYPVEPRLVRPGRVWPDWIFLARGFQIDKRRGRVIDGVDR